MYQLRPIEDLVKLENNPRIIGQVEMAKLIQSLRDNPKHFKARPLILSDRTGELVIISGNQRYDAAKFLEMDVVPTFLLQGLTEDQEKEISIRENISSGTWDFTELHENWNVAQLSDWGLDISFPPPSEEPEKEPPIDPHIIKLEYTLDDYLIVKEQLSAIAPTPEQAVWKLLGNK